MIFFAVTLVAARRLAFTHSGAVAMAMEGSSPALNLFQLLRMLEIPWMEPASYICLGTFVLSFFYFRVYLMGRVVLGLGTLRALQPEAIRLSHVPAWEADAVLALWCAGWLLQLYWAVLIVLKIVRIARRFGHGAHRQVDK